MQQGSKLRTRYDAKLETSVGRKECFGQIKRYKIHTEDSKTLICLQIDERNNEDIKRLGPSDRRQRANSAATRKAMKICNNFRKSK